MKIDQESSQPKRLFLTDYKTPAFQVKSLDLHFNLHETATLVTATLQIEKINNEPLILDGENLVLKSIEIDGHELKASEYVVETETLTVLNAPKLFTLKTIVEINPQENKSCEGLYLSQGIFATQCEAEGFRHITYFLDRPDVMTAYSVTLEADQKKYPVLLSNGDLSSKQNLNNGRHEVTWKDPFKKPCYLFALVAGDIGVVEGTHTTASGKKIKLEVYASHGKQARCQHALESLRKSMVWDEQKYGLEYDLNQYMIVSIDDFNMGAMENKGLNIFNSRLVLAETESATDTDFERIESVVGHEYFHNWTGNRVTCRNWFELSLKEGLTVFRDQEFSSDLNSRAVQRIKDVDSLRSRQFAEDAGPNSHPVRPESCLAVDNFYTATIYEKGAEVIRMMQTIVGTKGFRKGMDEYFKRHDGEAVTILDFTEAIAKPNNADFTQFKLWYSQAGTPEVSVAEEYNSAAKQYTLTLTQSCALTEKQPIKKPFHIPLLIGLIGQSGEDLMFKSDDVAYNSDEKPVLHLKQNTQVFTFQNVTEKPVLSLNREFSAPIKLNWKASSKELLHLIKFDQDSFNRREASFKMLLEEQRRLISAIRLKQNPTVRTEIIEALGTILLDQKIDSQFKALMLQLPDTDIIAQEESILDAAAFAEADELLIKTFVSQFETDIRQMYSEHHKLNSSGDRALKNRLLQFMASAQVSDSTTLAYAQFTQAQNMTDTIGALVALSTSASAENTKALSSFYERWNQDAVVFNKWLQVQAAAPLKNRLGLIKEIMQNAAFSDSNPNNIYSLHSVYGHNQLAFQSESEHSFNWLCDEIIRIDKTNAQVAARLCGCFNFVKKYPESIRLRAQTEIKRVLEVQTLSKNARELLEGCL